jgi:outer membrane receptor protein involved in Fe transport
MRNIYLTIKRCALIGTCILMQHISASAQEMTGISGKIISAEDRSAIDFADIYLKETTYGCITDENGTFRLEAPQGTYTLAVAAIGYGTYETTITLSGRDTTLRTIALKPARNQLDEVVVISERKSHVRQSAFNAVDLSVKEMHNSSRSLGEALSQLPGLKLRESGGVGSDAQLTLDGFSGKHVKVFIDGVPQEGAGTALDINNLPVNFAERIEVYKGVVPVGFGSDALGGVINIVTKKRRHGWSLDASYSYGSFNTHKSYVNFSHTLRNGLAYEINAFQNYSDNNYWIDNYITEFGDDGISENTDRSKIYHVRRFNDRFHNEAVIGKFGVTGKSWADRLMLGFNYSHFYKEIQTGVYQYIVFGQKHRKGHSLVPSLEYSKRNLFTKGLDVMLNANYNHNTTMNIDTSSFKYNWLGDRKYTGSRGEQSYQDNRSLNTNFNATFTAEYRLKKAHTFTLNHVSSTFRRTTRSKVDGSQQLSDFSIPKVTRKNITGLSYRLMPSRKWSVTAFGKYYNQYNRGPVSQSSDGVGNYVEMSRTTNAFGYGAAGTWFIIKGLQVKLSYEKAYRLPTTDELFGDEDLEAGKTDLRPENSDNVNLNLGYSRHFGEHFVNAEGTLIFRDTKDYIQRGLSTVSGMSYGFYENHGRVRTQGYNISARYGWSRWLSIGGTFSNINVRDHERYVAGNTLQESETYGQRMPNQPYMFASFDATFTWHNLFADGNTLTVAYDGYYQHAFPLYWEHFGDPVSKSVVPDQLSHNLSISYSLQNGRYNISLECRNLTNEKLYDNFSLQKAGRAFYAKVRVFFGSRH